MGIGRSGKYQVKWKRVKFIRQYVWFYVCVRNPAGSKQKYDIFDPNLNDGTRGITFSCCITAKVMTSSCLINWKVFENHYIKLYKRLWKQRAIVGVHTVCRKR